MAHTRSPSVMRQWLLPAATALMGGRPMTSMATTPPDLLKNRMYEFTTRTLPN